MNGSIKYQYFFYKEKLFCNTSNHEKEKEKDIENDSD